MPANTINNHHRCQEPSESIQSAHDDELVVWNFVHLWRYFPSSSHQVQNNSSIHHIQKVDPLQKSRDEHIYQLSSASARLHAHLTHKERAALSERVVHDLVHHEVDGPHHEAAQEVESEEQLVAAGVRHGHCFLLLHSAQAHRAVAVPGLARLAHCPNLQLPLHCDLQNKNNKKKKCVSFIKNSGIRYIRSTAAGEW